METTVNVTGGRLVLPPEVARALGTAEGQAVRVVVEGGRALLTPAAGPARPAAAGGLGTAVPASGGPAGATGSPAGGGPGGWATPAGWAPAAGSPSAAAAAAPNRFVGEEARPPRRALRTFLYVVIASLSAAALLGVALVAFGTRISSTQARVLGTAVAVGSASLLGMCSAAWYDRRERLWLPAGGLATSGLALLLTIVAIWGDPGGDGYWRALACAVIVAVAWALASLLLHFHGRADAVDTVVLVTIGLIAVFTAMVVIPLAVAWSGPQTGYVRAAGVVLILAVLGSVVTPILARASRNGT